MKSGWNNFLLVAGVEEGDSRADEPDSVVAIAVVVVVIVDVVVVVATVTICNMNMNMRCQVAKVLPTL